MDEIKLIVPTMEYADDILAFRQEILDLNPNVIFHGCNELGEYTCVQAWLDYLKCLEKAETCPNGFVPADAYLAVRVSDNRIVGMTDIRHHIDHPILGLWGGHIGYTIRPCERKKGYGKEMLRLNLIKCRERGLKKVMLSCKEGNIASERTILANGGVFSSKVPVDGEIMKVYWIEL